MPSARNSPPRVLIIGAGSRGHAYARALHNTGEATIQSVAEPLDFKRKFFVSQYISSSTDDSSFDSWQSFLTYEKTRREREEAGENVSPGVQAVFVCTLDATHRPIIEALAPFKLHVMCEKPLATTLQDCVRMWRALGGGENGKVETVFSVGHVLRYSPHNMMLRRLVRDENTIGDVLSVEHTEPVGWWHYSHSYVRGNWRNASTSAPALLTKSGHDIDFLLWLLSEPSRGKPHDPHHLPSRITSFGHQTYFKKSRKPRLAGSATNCFSCPAEPTCAYSAKSIYVTNQLDKGNADWPVNVLVPEIEDLVQRSGPDSARERLLDALKEDYEPNTPKEEVEKRGWYGRCVYESDNTVVDDQVVTLSWDESEDTEQSPSWHTPKTASFHMVAFTHAQCDRRGWIYGTEGEISYDSNKITVYKFATRETETFYPKQEGGGHGGGDGGLARQFVRAVRAVDQEEMSVEEAQKEFVGCGLEDVVRGHAVVWAAEEARLDGKVVDWDVWWKENVLKAEIGSD